MVLKIRYLRLAIKFRRICNSLADDLEGMQLAFHHFTAWLAKIRWRKWCKWIVRMIAFGVTVTGAVTAASSATSAGTGVALTAAGATGTYATTKRPAKGYEKIKHVSPVTSKRSAAVNMHRYHPCMMTKRENGRYFSAIRLKHDHS